MKERRNESRREVEKGRIIGSKQVRDMISRKGWIGRGEGIYLSIYQSNYSSSKQHETTDYITSNHHTIHPTPVSALSIHQSKQDTRYGWVQAATSNDGSDQIVSKQMHSQRRGNQGRKEGKNRHQASKEARKAIFEANKIMNHGDARSGKGGK